MAYHSSNLILLCCALKIEKENFIFPSLKNKQPPLIHNCIIHVFINLEMQLLFTEQSHSDSNLISLLISELVLSVSTNLSLEYVRPRAVRAGDSD